MQIQNENIEYLFVYYGRPSVLQITPY